MAAAAAPAAPIPAPLRAGRGPPTAAPVLPPPSCGRPAQALRS